MEITFSTNDFQIIWLDNQIDDVKSSDYVHRKVDFDHLIEHLKVYNELLQCQQYIVSLGSADKVFLIVSGSLGEKILQSIHEQVQIVCIYIFCIDTHKHQEWGKKFHKIRGIFNESNAMMNRLQRDVQLLVHHFTPVNIFTMQNVKETTLQNIDQEQATYMWFQLLIETLLRLPQTSQAHRELIDECMKHYRNNDVEKRKIEQFAVEYSHENIIEWYTRDCFLYRLVNRAFRTRNIDIIFKYRHFIVDLHQRLVELHEKQYSTETSVNLTVYRGQLISAEELNKLKTNINGIFSVNTFLSTTTRSNVALNFINDAFDRPFLEKVLYEININGQNQYKWPFADIHDISCNTHEGEILLDIGSTFRIDDVYEYTADLWYVSLTLLDINDPSTKIDTKLYDYLVENSLNKDVPTLLILCYFLEQMGEFERSRQFCQSMLRDIHEGQQFIDIHAHLALIEYDLGNLHKAKTICEEALAMQIDADKRNGGTTASSALNHLHSHLGLILSELGDCKGAIFHYQQAVLIDEVVLVEDDEDRAVGFNNLGMAYKDLGDFKEALYWLEERALKFQLSKLPHTHPDLAITYSNIGETYSENGNYTKAREMYDRVLAIEKQALPPLHPSTKTTFNNLAVVSEKIGDYDAALAYHRQALEILLHSYSLDHISFATTYNNMAVVFDHRGDFDEALCHYNKALEYLLASVGTEDHPNIASTYNNIGMIHYQKKEYEKALEYFEKTQKIEECLLERNHSSLATTYNNLGMVFAAQDRLKQAMQYHQRALTIRRRVLSKTHPELAASYDNLGVVYYKHGFYKTAIDSYQRALCIQNKSLPYNHPAMATTKEHLGDVYCRLGNHRAALKCYTDALTIVQACLPALHPSIKQYSAKINQMQAELTKK
jgi:tetratricopeptide (TPR) repeat protein